MVKKRSRVSKKKIKKLDASMIQKDIDFHRVHFVAKLHAVKFAVAGGIVFGLLNALMTIAGIYGYFTECGNLILSIYGIAGYSVSWLGVALGAIYGFVDGFIFAGAFAWFYNRLGCF